MDNLERTLRQHAFLEGLSPEHVKVLVGCAKNERFPAGSYLSREGADEARVYLIRKGAVSLEVHRPGGEPTVIETLEAGDVMGISWITPATAHYDCRARETVVAFSLDNACMQRKMRDDPALGYALALRFLDLTYRRLARLRTQHLDLYA